MLGADTVFLTNSHCSDSFGYLDSIPFTQNQYGPRFGFEIDDVAPRGGYHSFAGGFYCGSSPGCRASDSQISEFYDTVSVVHGRIAKTASVSTTMTNGSLQLAASPSYWSIGQTLGLADFVVGMDVDKVGRTTGWTRGEIAKTCITSDYGVAVFVCIMAAEYYAIGGDSGSPIFVPLYGNHVALAGIHFGQAPSGNNRHFSTLDGIEYDFNITLDVIGDPVPPIASIVGPDEVNPNEDCSWEAEVQYGNSPFTYSWWGVLSGSGPYVDGSVSSSGYLYLAVSDSENEADTTQLYIDSDSQFDGCGEGG